MCHVAAGHLCHDITPEKAAEQIGLNALIPFVFLQELREVVSIVLFYKLDCSITTSIHNLKDVNFPQYKNYR